MTLTTPPPRDMRNRMATFVKQLQKDIVAGLEEVDGGKFKVESWTRKEGGEGISCVIEDSHVFERGGVMVSVVNGTLPPEMAFQMRSRGRQLDLEGKHDFFAAGISMVLHPRNPMAPTVHLNYRYFEVAKEDTKEVVSWWFGGGADLTPSILFEEDAIHFHRTYKTACDKHSPEYYPKFKKWCDEYFTITHRGECRGIGGIFFDDFDSRDPEEIFAFVQDCGKSFLPSYVPILSKRKNMTFTEEQKRWQQIRRGRYVEFNLIHDRGTKFGLATPGARIEAILVSMPQTARWEYMHQPEPGSDGDKLLRVLKEPKDWLAEN